MKKFLLTVLLSLSCIFGVCGFVACNGDTYTVTFDAKTGEFDNGKNQKKVKVDKDTPVSPDSVEDPTLEGYRFLYWEYDGVEYTFDTVVSEDMTLEAYFVPDQSYKVTFTQPDDEKSFSYVSETNSGDYVAHSEKVTFSLDIGAFYGGVPTVTVNGEKISANDNGEYVFTVRGESTVSVSGIVEAVASLAGSGTVTDVYFIATPADLVYVAEQINKGNTHYVTAYYQLANDIDFKGEEMIVIGDGSTDYSFFGGYINGMGYTISNFVINSHSTNYVGLFGLVSSVASDSNSGTIYNLNVKDYTINADLKEAPASADKFIYAGSLIGFGTGARVLVCTATGGTLNVTGALDDVDFSMIGGFVGVLQSFYDASMGIRYVSSLTYTHVEAEVNALGYVMAAGGLVGYTLSNEQFSTVDIINCYANCDIYGPMQAGGLVGRLGSYSSVTNCYATGNANAVYDLGSNLLPSYRKACAGGLVGYMENEAIITNSFATGDSYASATTNAPNEEAHRGDIVGYTDPNYTLDIFSQSYAPRNVLFVEGGVSNTVDLKDTTTVKSQLYWTESDWIFENGKYPAINFSSSSYEYVLTSEYVNAKVQDKTKTNLDIEDSYMPLSYLYLNGYVSDYATADDGKIAFGFYFDKALTEKIPYCFVPTRDMTIYVGFADYKEVAGESGTTYALATDNASDAYLITLYKDGACSYTDGATTSKGEYVYNSAEQTLRFYGVRFARYFDNAELGVEDMLYIGDYQLDQFYLVDFKARVTQDGLSLYDGTYFTANKPLLAQKNHGINASFYLGNLRYDFYYALVGDYKDETGTTRFSYTIDGANILVTIGNETRSFVYDGKTLQDNTTTFLPTHTVFQGTWANKNNAEQTYTFDGKGNWRNHRNENGAYTYVTDPNGDYLTFTHNEIAYTVTLNDEGFLTLSHGDKTTVYCKAGSFTGEWTDLRHGITLRLDGIAYDGNAYGQLVYNDGYTYDITYEIFGDYVLIYIASDIYGYIAYNADADTLDGTMYYYDDQLMLDGFTDGFRFWNYDVLKGAWITDGDPLFEIVEFNGFGRYNVENYPAYNGNMSIKGELTLLINGEPVKVTYTLTDSVSGTFTYDNVSYVITFSEDMETITITTPTKPVTLERKDVYSTLTLLDENWNEYTFDGRGNLTNKGNVFINGKATNVSYTITQTGASLSDGTNEGTLSVNDDGVYVYTLGDTTVQLTVKNFYTGKWAISGAFDTLEIGGASQKGVMKGKYLGKEITLTMDEDTAKSYITFAWKENGQTDTVYVLNINDTELGISSYDSPYYGFTTCTRADKMYGTWTKKISNNFVYTYTFDGVSSSTQTNGQATRAYNSKTYECYYRVDKYGNFLVWDKEASSDGVAYSFMLKMVSTDTKNAFVSEDGTLAFLPVQVDSFYLIEASVTHSNGGKTTYEFNGLGKITNMADPDEYYTYDLKTDVVFNSTTASATVVVLGRDGLRYTLLVDYSDSSNITLTFTLHQRAKDTANTVYEFDMNGTITKLDANGNRTATTYTYNVKTVVYDQTAKTATMQALGSDGRTYTVKVNYTNKTDLRITVTAVE